MRCLCTSLPMLSTMHGDRFKLIQRIHINDSYIENNGLYNRQYIRNGE